MSPQIDDFLSLLEQHYREFGRHDMLWRQPESDGSFNAYKILVSELMLQQTQVSRVTPKFEMFLLHFPTIRALAAATLGEVLVLWSGLGYNRRAKFLWLAAASVMTDFGGDFPRSQLDLQRLPGVGPNTAGAIMAYAYDQPVVYVETNIRTVLIHHFFNGQTAVSDAELRPILQAITSRITAVHAEIAEPAGLSTREFYWAMMDYGAHLKKTIGNASRDSKHYVKQSSFHGSSRQLRGLALRLLTDQAYSRVELIHVMQDKRSPEIVDGLLNESMIIERTGVLQLP